MATVTKNIGLSLGADICWPICYEGIMRELDLALPIGRNTVRFAVERVSIEPFQLAPSAKYDLVIDRLTHWFHVSREWIKKGILQDGMYVFNNPWSVQSMEKQTTYCAMLRLGLPIPRTWLVPPKEYLDSPDLQPTLQQYARYFDLSSMGKDLGYPMFMKPYDGGGWVGVRKIDDEAGLKDAYEKSGRFVMHLQEGIVPYDCFVRCVGLGPQVRAMRYDPSAPQHERYEEVTDFLSEEDASLLRDLTLTINAFFGWDFNSCESLLHAGVWHPIDFANPCPDSQVTSLHLHFPWYVKANLRWSIYCAATGKKMRPNLDWTPFFKVADMDLPYREKLQRYAQIADKRFETARFEAFCAKHLSHLDEVAWNYFGTDAARAAVRQKVQAIFPEHEWDEFSDHFWERIQKWRELERAEDKP